MKPRLPLLATLTFVATTSQAAGIDMSDPRRALGREDDVRIDAQLIRETVSPGSPIGVTYQIQNLTSSPVAIAHKVSDASYDSDTRTITVSIGSEVPVDGAMPVMVTIRPGEKKVLRSAATPALSASAMRNAARFTPRYVQVKVTILRDLEPFIALIEGQSRVTTPQPLSDELFEQWLECSDTIFLNTLPVHWTPGVAPAGLDVENRGTRTRGF